MTIVSAMNFTEYIRNEIGSADATMIAQAQAAAESMVTQYCGRSFALTAAVATARVFGPSQMTAFRRVVRVNDFTDTASLIVSNNGTIVTSSEYQLEPLNGISINDEAVAYEQIRLLTQFWWTDLINLDKATVTITAKWGWTAVPAAVTEAVKLIGKDWVQQRDTKFGYQDTSGGPVSAGRNWVALSALDPYRRAEVFM